MLPKIILFIMVFVCFFAFFRVVSNQYYFLPVGKTPDDYMAVRGTVVYLLEKRENRDNRIIIKYQPIVSFVLGSETLYTPVSYESRYIDCFQIGEEVDIFYRDLRQDGSEKTAQMLEWFGGIASDLRDIPFDISYEYETFFQDPEIYTALYPKWNKVALLIIGILLLALALCI